MGDLKDEDRQSVQEFSKICDVTFFAKNESQQAEELQKIITRYKIVFQNLTFLDMFPAEVVPVIFESLSQEPGLQKLLFQ